LVAHLEPPAKQTPEFAQTFSRSKKKRPGNAWLSLLISAALLLSMPLNFAGLNPLFGSIPIFLVINFSLQLVLTWNWVAQRSADRRFAFTAASMTATSFVGSMLVTNLVNPSPGFVVTVLGVASAMLTTAVVTKVFRHSLGTAIIRSLSAFLFVQFLVGVAQITQNGAVGHGLFAENENGFRRINGTLSPSGTLEHTFLFGSYSAISVAILLACIAQRPLSKLDRRISSISVVVGATLVGLSLSRSAVMSLLIILLGGLISKNRRQLLVLIVAAFVAFGGTIAFRSDAWSNRAKATSAGLEKAGSGRMALNRQAIKVFQTSPVFGVGPGNYRAAVTQNPEIRNESVEQLPVHNLFLYVLATLGIVGSISFLILWLVVFRRVASNGLWGLVTLASILPPLMLDLSLMDGRGLFWLALVLGFAQAARFNQLLNQERVAPQGSLT
jgi:O-antigen ligase